MYVMFLLPHLLRQSRSTMATQDIGETINATNVIEGISPHWNEMIYADILEETNHSEGNSSKPYLLNGGGERREGPIENKSDGMLF